MTFLEKLDLLAAKMLAEGRMPSPTALVQALLAVGGGAGRVRLARPDPGMIGGVFRAKLRGDKTASLAFADHLQEQGVPGAHVVREAVKHTGPDYPEGAYMWRDSISPAHTNRGAEFADGWRWRVHGRLSPASQREGRNAGKPSPALLSIWHQDKSGDTYVRHQTPVFSLAHAVEMTQDWPEDHRKKLLRSLKAHGVPATHDEPLRLARDPEVHAHENTVADEHVHDPHAWMILADHYQDAGEPGAEHLREHGRQLAAGLVVAKHDGASRQLREQVSGWYSQRHDLHTPDTQLHTWRRVDPGAAKGGQWRIPPVTLTRFIKTRLGGHIAAHVAVTPDNVDALADELHPDDAKLVREHVAKHWALS